MLKALLLLIGTHCQHAVAAPVPANYDPAPARATLAAGASFPFPYNWSKFPAAWFAANTTDWEDEAQLDEIGNDGWNRGNTEFLFSGMFAPTIQGPNPWFAGGLFGPRYNFIQPDWPVVPYLESRVGFLFTHATGAPDSQGQDFCFSFTIGAGVRIPVMDQLSVNLGVMFQHISNAGLSEPQNQNVGLDSIGPTLSVSWAF